MASGWAFVPAKPLSQHLSVAWLFPRCNSSRPGLTEEVPAASGQPRLPLHFHRRGQKSLQ